MAFDYDLVIIGGSMAARYAAAKASRLRARVALVEPEDTRSIELPILQHCALRQLRTLVQQVWQAKSWDIGQTSIAADTELLSWQRVLQWVQHTTETIVDSEITEYSLPQLASSGVDVVLGDAAFYPDSKRQQRTRSANLPVVLANGRYLRSRKYLLAPAATAVVPDIEGLTATDYRTIASFWQNPWTALPQHLTVLGGDPRGIELAQLCSRLGCQVTLIVSGTQLLPNEDAETIALLQALLEAEGIEILIQTRVTQVKQLGEQTWIQAGDRALQTNALLLATRLQVDLAALNLQAIGVAEKQYLQVNRRLQTSHPHIYACGDGLGGYTLAHVAAHEVEVALNHALFGTPAHVNYAQLPWSMFTSPTLARVGLTEAQARAYYGEDVVVLQRSLQTLSYAQVGQETIGSCKLIVRRNGEILGGHSLAPQAEEWVSTLALAMQHRIKLSAINPATFSASTFSEVLAHLIEQWQEYCLPNWQRNLWESWFNWRRS